jgi:thiol-disulfide isomerase/thioredoxin
MMNRILFALIVLVTINNALVNGKKSNNRDLINKLDNIKGFKKLLRTKTNILVMFAKNEEEATKNFGVYGDAAAKAKGIGTLAWVDCSDKDGKKLCKNQKIKPDSIEIVHYKDGENAGKYERKFSVKSLHAFLKNPTGDGPWDEEDSAKDVVHLSSENQIKKVVKKNKPTLIMFYAPWCGHCKRFKPVFAEVATDMKKKTLQIVITIPKNGDAATVREAFNVTGFPRTLYFANGEFQFEYSGGHTAQGLMEWLDDPQPPKEKEPEVAWSDGENDVYHLDDETFDSFIDENEKVLII